MAVTTAVVTGASGFVGGAVAHALASRGVTVRSLDSRPGPGVTVADVSRPGDWQRALDGADLVVHAAMVGAGGVGELTPVRAGRPSPAATVTDERLRQVVLGGTATVIDACERAGVSRLIHMSCVNVVGTGEVPVDETAPVGLTGDRRADALAAAEQAVMAAAAHGVPATVLRLGDAYGPRAGRWTLWPVLLLRAGRFALVDGGVGTISPVHVDDVVDATLAVADAPTGKRGEPGAVVGEVLHVTGGEAVTAAEFFGYYCEMLDSDPPRSVPARVVTAVDGLERMRAVADGRLRRSQAAGDRDQDRDRDRRTLVPNLVRGVGQRFAAGVHPRTHLDLGPLTVRELTRPGTYSIDKIGGVVGWRPKVGLADGMARTESWLRERGLLGVREPSRRG